MKRLVIPLLAAWAGLGFASARADLAALGATDSPAPAPAPSAVADPPSIWTGQRMPPPSEGEGLRNEIAMSDDVALVGDSDQVHVYRKDAGQWIEHQTLRSGHPASSEMFFGGAIAMRGSHAVIGYSISLNGAFFTSPAPAYGLGAEADPAAHVFEERDGAWIETARLMPDDGAPGSSWRPGASTFATSVAIDGSTVAVGAFQHTADPSRPHQGAVYVFTNDGGVWRQTQKLLPDDGRGGDSFGNAVALQGDTLLIGAREATRNRDFPLHGLVYVFKRQGGLWTQRQTLFAPTLKSGAQFGQSLALDGDTAIVGEPGGLDHAGAAHALRRNNDLWQVAQTLPSTGAVGIRDTLGFRVALSGDRALVSAFQSVYTDGLVQQGVAYIYERIDGRWRRRARLTSPEGTDYGFFGAWVGLSGRSAIVGSMPRGNVFAFEAHQPPSANPGSPSVRMALPVGEKGHVPLRIDNSGDETLDFALGNALPAAAAPLRTAEALDPTAWKETLPPASPLAVGPIATRRTLDAPRLDGSPLDFALDDGSFQIPLSFGRDYWEQSAIWLNRFAAPAGTGAFTLDSVSILFPPQTLGTLVGKSINLVAYFDAQRSGEPTYAVRLGSDHFVTIAGEGQFQTFATNFRVPGDGDVYVGFETSYARGGSWPQLYPVAVNTNTPRFARSWHASMGIGAANLDELSANTTQGFIENHSRGGNWLIRATGTDPDNDCIDPQAASWLVATPASGSIAAGGSTSILLALNAAGLAEGTHAAQLCVASNDPGRPMQRVPVVLTVVADGTIFRDGFEGTP